VWVARRDGVEHLIPATHDAVVDVDLERGRVTVADWLLEVEEA
jgi:ribosomal 30S subunit maturation factor RimM